MQTECYSVVTRNVAQVPSNRNKEFVCVGPSAWLLPSTTQFHGATPPILFLSDAATAVCLRFTWDMCSHVNIKSQVATPA